jgi:predicted phage baseplate assembly protein
MSDPACPCDVTTFPPALDISAGLSSLPRQIGGFPEFRAAMLSALTEAGAINRGIAGWRARDAGDLGVMLLEMWAYVCDVVAFYDQLTANEAYLRTAGLPPSLRRLVELIGYLPRPEIAASADLGVLVDGRVPVTLPGGTAFRSAAFAGNPPQVFETAADATVSPDANQWGVRPPQAAMLSGSVTYLMLDPATSRVQRDSLLYLELDDGSGTVLWVGRAARVSAASAADGSRYTRVDLQANRPFVLSAPVPAARVRVLMGTQKTGLWTQALQADDPSLADAWYDFSSFGSGSGGSTFSYGFIAVEPSGTALLLNSLNRGFAIGDRLVLEVPGDVRTMHVAKFNEPPVTVVPSQTITVDGKDVTTPATKVPTTRLYTDAVVPGTDTFFLGSAGTTSPWSDLSLLTVNYGFVDAGVLVSPSATVLTDSDPIGLTLLHVPPSGPPAVHAVLLASADQRGVQSPAAVDFTAATLTLDSTTTWQPPLELPVTVYGNVLPTTRGETVPAEILGSGDPTQRYQSFVLQKKPLTYLPSASAQNNWGVVSTLRIMVSGVAWTEVPTLYGVAPTDQVYVVRRRDDGASVVTFGSPLPAGAGNVVATYRFGGGAASPPAFGITQIARPTPGLRSVVNPVAASGGADAEGPDSIRTAAPKWALLLGRAVSIDDFTAAASAIGGVRFAKAAWRWSPAKHRPVVQVWYIGPDGLKAQISQRLRGIADPSTPIDVKQAMPQTAALSIDVETDPLRDTATVTAAVRAELLAPRTGVLEPEMLGVSTPVFRAAIMRAVLSVAGAVSVRALGWNGADFSDFGHGPQPGCYFDFENSLTVTGSPSNG